METLNSLTVNVDLQNPYDFEELPLIADIQKWCEASIQENASTKAFDNRLSLLIRVVDSAESADLNENYRSKKGPTNVLSFPNEIPDFMLDIPDLKEQSSALGDLVICEPIVRKESLEQEKSLMAHWAHLVIHGVLHLQGFDHIEDNEAVEMETLEVKILEQFGYTDPYANIS